MNVALSLDLLLYGLILAGLSVLAHRLAPDFAGIQEMKLDLKERFDAESIEFAFPTQTLYLKQDSGAQSAAA